MRFNGKLSYPARVTIITGLTTLVVMTLYEALKTSALPGLTPWASHSITIVFTSGLAMVIAFFVGVSSRAAHRAIVAAKATVNEELKLRKRFRRMSELLVAARTREEIATILDSHLEQSFPGASGAVCLFSPSRDVVETLVSWGVSVPDVREFSVDSCWALRLGKPYGPDESGKQVHCAHWAPGDQGTHLCVPMLADGETLGVFCVRLTGETAQPGSAGLESFIGMAERLSLPLANLRLRETLRNQSIKDGLTGVFNRRYMEESLGRELTRATRRNDPISVVMMDLDHFKRLNDTCGHDAGDELLRAFGRFLSTRLRNEDVVCRYGGEEFVLILPETSCEAAIEVADRLRTQFAEIRIDNRSGGYASATFSAGIASFPSDGRSPAELLRAADRALYHAKSAGRNQVHSTTRQAIERVA